MDNIKKAEYTGKPMCQDTGIPIFYVRGNFDSSIADYIASGIKKATVGVPLRPNTVDPITRENSSSNLGCGMPIIHYIPTKDNFLEIMVLPKGAGSENMTHLAMLNPAVGLDGIKRFVVESILDSGSKPCPPSIIGVGIGGTSDKCVEMATEALLISLDIDNPDPILDKLEKDIFVSLNKSGLGPMGLGG